MGAFFIALGPCLACCTAKLHFNYFDRHRCSNIGLWKLEGEFMTNAGARTLEECSVFKAKCCIGYGVLLIHRKKTFLFLFQLIATSTRWHSKAATFSPFRGANHLQAKRWPGPPGPCFLAAQSLQRRLDFRYSWRSDMPTDTQVDSGCLPKTPR